MLPNNTIYPSNISGTQSAVELILNWNHSYPMTLSTSTEGNRVMDEDSVPAIVPDIKLVVGGVITPIFCVLGMVGNFLAVITWSRPALRSSTGRFLTAQAVTDFGVLFTWILVTSVKQWYPDVRENQTYMTFFSHIAMPFHFFFLHCSVWITLAITIERYIMVCWATHARRLCGMKQSALGVVIILVFSAMDNIPHFMYGVTRDSVASDVINLPAIKLSGSDADYRAKIYGLYFFCICLIAMPWFFVLFFNYKIVSAIVTSNRRMLDKKTEEASIKAKKTEWQITRLLLAVSFVYLCAMGPFCLVQIALILDSEGIDSDHKQVAINITVAGHVINSSLNFILYCMMGRRFRRELKTMLGIKLSESDMTTNYTTSTNDEGARSYNNTKCSVNVVKIKT